MTAKTSKSVVGTPFAISKYFASPVLKRRYVRSDDIFNVDIIAVFGSVPIYYRLHPGEHLLRKDSENAGLSFSNFDAAHKHLP